jgi:crotonobetaine/carnitine-CoA ligase
LSGELERRAAESPGKTWLVFEAADGSTESYSYAEFQRAVDRTAAVLTDLGVCPGDKMLLHLANCPEFLLLWFGAARIGAIVVPTNVQSSDAELEFLCQHSESVLVVVGQNALDRARHLRATCPTVRGIVVCRGDGSIDAPSFDALLARSEPTPPAHRPRSEDEVAILYTSGTTSRPKGCLITNANYVHVGEAVAQHIALTPQDRQFAVLPYFHGNAQYYSTMSALVVGASVAFTERFSASRYFAQAARLQGTVASLFAAPMRMLLAQPEPATLPEHRLRVVYFAQNVTPAQLDEWQRRFRVPLLQIYGMTEQLGWPLANPLHGGRDNMSVGRPTLPFHCRVVDGEGRDVADGEVGELLVQGAPGTSLMKGYFKDPAATAAAIQDGWLRTGDNVRSLEDGLFEFVDRSKDMIKRAGENVAAGEVEAVLKEHPGIFDAAVIGVPDPIRDEMIKAYVVPREGHDLSALEVIAWCAARLARFRVPELVELRDELPRTSVGKIQKHILRAEHAAAVERAPDPGP